MPNIEISIYDILGYLGERSRPLKEGEEVFKAGHVILCGLDALDIEKITALCLQTSSLTSGPPKITIELSDNTKDWKCICTCEAGMSGACKHIVAALIYVNRNLPINLLVRIISCLRIEVYLVNDIIIKANTPGTSMYFISTGTVAIYTKSGKEICHLEDGSHFGEIALIIKDTLRTASVIAVEVSEIYRLDQKDFVKAINPYPDLLANIQHIAAERMEVATMLDDYNKKEHSTKR